jgi:hypothetical protein
MIVGDFVKSVENKHNIYILLSLDSGNAEVMVVGFNRKFSACTYNCPSHILSIVEPKEVIKHLLEEL